MATKEMVGQKVCFTDFFGINRRGVLVEYADDYCLVREFKNKEHYIEPRHIRPNVIELTIMTFKH